MRENSNRANGPALTRRGMLTALASGALVLGAAEAASAATPTPLPSPPARKANPNGTKPPVVGGTTKPTQKPMGVSKTTANVDDARARATVSVGLPRAGSGWERIASTGPWNLAFVSWLLYPDGSAAPTTLNALRDYAKANGRLGTTPRAGAVVLHESAAPGDIAWCGYVESVTGLAIITIAGDVPSPIPSDQTFVRRFSRPLSSKLSYFYPDYRI
jgi:hypothetical protein